MLASQQGAEAANRNDGKQVTAAGQATAHLEGAAGRRELGAGPAPCLHGTEQALHGTGEGVQVLTAQHYQ